MKIYTRGGDSGSTVLFGDSVKHPKSEQVFEVLGTLDELSAFLGITHNSRIKEIKQPVLEIQANLLDIGSYVAGKEASETTINIWQQKVTALEALIDTFEQQNDTLSNFILPGGSDLSAKLHMSRAISRRLERTYIKYIESLDKRQAHLETFQKYLNRLSDLLFVMARFANKRLGVKDLVWNN